MIHPLALNHELNAPESRARNVKMLVSGTFEDAPQLQWRIR